LNAAKDKLFNEFKVTDEADKTKLLDSFKKFDSGAISVDNIYNDLLKTYVSNDPAKFIQAMKEVESMKTQAEELKAFQAGGGFTGSDSAHRAEVVELTESDKLAARWANIPEEKYKELKAQGKV
jgi:hypothetical protein